MSAESSEWAKRCAADFARVLNATPVEDIGTLEGLIAVALDGAYGRARNDAVALCDARADECRKLDSRHDDSYEYQHREQEAEECADAIREMEPRL